ncbi:uncharacterized protein LOC127707888 [Mytilus californianus]|uniref:uncharacterized protein LOC127707888 n=1 Tax=Mytilus californianus TaxID=6549 RepID=UPI0022470A7B|nr:uncharacterized protein LOC127707888 [Mytilus californianus]
MENIKRILPAFAILNVLPGISCEDDAFTGVVAASTVAGVLFCLVILVAVIFAIWRDAYRKIQLKRGRFKVPRSWIDQERLAKIEKRKRIKRQMKEQMKQKNAIKDKQNGGLDMEMNYLHRSRPQIPGSWRREVRHPNGYIVKEVPTLQRTVVLDNQQIIVDVVDNDSALWQRGHNPSGIRYSSLTNPSTAVPVSSRSDGDSSSVSSTSTARVKDKEKTPSVYIEAEVIEATIDFTNDGTIGDERELQERVTAF